MCLKIYDMFKEMAECFTKKISADYRCICQLNVNDLNESWYLIATNGKVEVCQEYDGELDVIVETTQATLQDIYSGKMTAFTAAGKAHVNDSAPLDWRMPKTGYVPEKIEHLYFFISHFFHPTEPEKILLGEEHSRVVHGGHAIPLYYYPGLRSSWYMVKKGEQINESGETDPFPQAFIFIEGEGYAKIGDKTVQVKAGESYYVPPNADQVIWTESEEPLVLIWLAWGPGA